MIRKLCLLLLVFASWLVALSAQPQRFPVALSARTASYDMDIRLDVDHQQVQATQTLIFTNPSADTIHTMRFHVYYNAWKNNQTDFFTETGRIPRDKPQAEIDSCRWSWINVTKITDEQGNDLTKAQAYVQPDDDNPFDQTVLEVRLVQPVLPHQTYRLRMAWTAQIPPLMIRTGYRKDYFFMAQWFPKLGVYEPAGTRFATQGQWNCHQYHAATEYYGEFGVYDVRLTVPSNYLVGASGFLVDKQVKGEETTHHYLAEDVIDFAWTAHPGFREVVEQWRDTEIHLLIRPEHLPNQERFLGAARHTLDFFADYLEPYPYPTLTIVSPPFYGLNSGAMEYPTLITSPTLSNLPAGLKTTETLVIHELIHQYFMQMLATNEQEEPWLDEGFTAYFEARILDQYYPEGTVSWPYLGLRVGSEELRRGRFFSAENSKANPLSDFGWHMSPGSYSPIVYGKTAVLLKTLAGLVGEACMQSIMRTYFQRWKFKHPGRQDFIDVVNEVVPHMLGDRYGPDMNWFLEPAIYGTDECDYAVHTIENKVLEAPLGFLENTDDCTRMGTASGAVIQAKATLFRLGEFVVPQEVRIVFDNGDEVLEHWDGRARTHEFGYTGSRKIVSVTIDPNNKIPLDKNLLNNSYVLEPDAPGITRYVTSFLTWLQAIMVSLGGLV
ncbi:MAG: peptidase M1 [Bacteroidetes bacterium]|nr:MAG: peptidase M1 [Bacteroidota bacterium]